MAIIVNKEEKRRAIAIACSDLLLERGIGDLTIAELAKTAGVGKGTIYEYFDNKEDIVFEIISTFMAEYEKILLDVVSEAATTKEKLFHFLSMLFADDTYQKHLRTYREYLAISLISGTEQMVAFSIGCKEKFAAILSQIIEEGIESGEILPETREFVPALLLFEKGLVVDTKASGVDADDEIVRLLDTLFKLIAVKGTK